MTEWILTHPRLAESAFFGGLIVLTVALLLGALELDRWWQNRCDETDTNEAVVAEAEAIVRAELEAIGIETADRILQMGGL